MTLKPIACDVVKMFIFMSMYNYQAEAPAGRGVYKRRKGNFISYARNTY